MDDLKTSGKKKGQHGLLIKSVSQFGSDIGMNFEI